jgi:hypothetical protein
MSGQSPVSDRVPVAPLRDAFETSGLTLSQVCRRLGWFAGPGKPDVARLKRSLGTQPVSTHKGTRYYAQRIGYEHATRIAEAIGVDPVDVGL